MRESITSPMKAREVCVTAPIRYSHLASLVRRGAIHPQKDGSGDHLFTAADLETARAAALAARDRAAAEK
jgi:hypothetical protein